MLTKDQLIAWHRERIKHFKGLHMMHTAFAKSANAIKHQLEKAYSERAKEYAKDVRFHEEAVALLEST